MSSNLLLMVTAPWEDFRNREREDLLKHTDELRRVYCATLKLIWREIFDVIRQYRSVIIGARDGRRRRRYSPR